LWLAILFPKNRQY